MPMDKKRYPKEWNQIAAAVKEAAGWKCQKCGKQCRRPGDPFDTHKNTLTVAHLNHTPEDVRPENLMAMCAPCHLQYDAKHHAETRRNRKMKNDTISRQETLEHLRKRLIETAFNNVGYECDAGKVFEDASKRLDVWLSEVPSAQPNLKGAKFEIICSQRQTGRTTKLIEKCARYRYALIVCPSRTRASNIFHYARKMGIHIPMPMTFGDFLQGRFAAEHINAFLIDDLDSCLEIYSHNVPIDTVVFEGRAEE